MQPDGRILIGGSFTNINGVGRAGLARLEKSGALDFTFSLFAQVSWPPGYGSVSSILAQPDSNLLVGGSFWTSWWGYRNGLVRLHADGELDTTFTPDLYGGMSLAGEMPNQIRALALQSDGRLLVLRDVQYGGFLAVPYLVRLNPDGSQDASFIPLFADTPSRQAFALALQPDGKILLGGYQMLFRLNADGSFDPSFAAGPLDWGVSFPHYFPSQLYPVPFFPYPSSAVATFLSRADGSILVGGNFVRIGEAPRFRFAELNPDGTPLGLTHFQPPVRRENGELLLRITVVPGQALVLQSSTDLREWMPLLEAVPASRVFELTLPAAELDGQRFYRVRPK